jgi:DNA-binding transcriptional MerR regulator
MEVWEQPAATPGFHKIWEFRLCSAAQHNGKTSPDFFDNFSFGVLHFPNCERRASREIWAGHYADSCVQWDGRPALHHHTGGNSCADLWLIKRYAADRQRHCTASDGEYNNDRAYNHERLASRCLSAGSDAASLDGDADGVGLSVGVSADTLRHYEKLGILATSQRTTGGYRMFPRSAVERVQLVQRALQLGFSLHELSEILRTRDNGGAPCYRVLNLTEDKLRSLDQQIEQLQQTQAYMRRLVREWKKKLKHTPPDSKAMLLHSLVDTPTKRSNNLKRRSRP